MEPIPIRTTGKLSKLYIEHLKERFAWKISTLKIKVYVTDLNHVWEISPVLFRNKLTVWKPDEAQGEQFSKAQNAIFLWLRVRDAYF